MGLAQQKQRSSTFAENVVLTDPARLTHADIGTTITVTGRNITLGQRADEPVPHTGELHEFRVGKGRVVLVLLVTAEHRQFRQPRVIETLVIV